MTFICYTCWTKKSWQQTSRKNSLSSDIKNICDGGGNNESHRETRAAILVVFRCGDDDDENDDYTGENEKDEDGRIRSKAVRHV